MAFDLEIISNEGNSPEPLFYSVMDAVSSMKEATADKIHKRIQQGGLTNYSKPQVERALANALKYGIFEVQNNRYRVRDDNPDDEDTIYWRAHINREKTPYRIEDSQGDYINPEKDRRTFRRFRIDDEEECVSRKKQKIAGNEVKGRKGKIRSLYERTPAVSSQNRYKKNKPAQDSKKKKEQTRGKKQKRSSKLVYKNPEKKLSQRLLRKLTEKDVKRIKRVAQSELPGQDTIRTTQEHESDSYTSLMDVTIKTDANGTPKNHVIAHKSRDNYDEEEEEYEDDEEVEDEDEDNDENSDEEDEDEDDCHCDSEDYEKPVAATSKNDNTGVRSAHLGYEKEPFKCLFYSNRKADTSIYSGGDLKDETPESNPSNHKRLENSYQNPSFKLRHISPDCNLDCRHLDSDPLSELCNKADWFGNRPQQVQDGMVKQFDNSLKIEPMDSLPFKNIEETSYIS